MVGFRKEDLAKHNHGWELFSKEITIPLTGKQKPSNF